jgi:hypothetical protein
LKEGFTLGDSGDARINFKKGEINKKNEIKQAYFKFIRREE